MINKFRIKIVNRTPIDDWTKHLEKYSHQISIGRIEYTKAEGYKIYYGYPTKNNEFAFMIGHIDRSRYVSKYPPPIISD